MPHSPRSLTEQDDEEENVVGSTTEEVVDKWRKKKILPKKEKKKNKWKSILAGLKQYPQDDGEDEDENPLRPALDAGTLVGMLLKRRKRRKTKRAEAKKRAREARRKARMNEQEELGTVLGHKRRWI